MKVNKIKKNTKWIILGITTSIFIIILLFLFENRISFLDNNIYHIISKWISEPMTNLALAITFFGSATAIIIIAIITSIVLAIKKKKYWKYIGINLIIVALCNQVIKFLVARPRPEGYRLTLENGYSFPSGHTMVSAGFYGFFIYLIYKKVKNKYVKWGTIIFLSLLVILIGISRIYLGVHFASDVLAGLCFSISYLIFFINLIKEKI